MDVIDEDSIQSAGLGDLENIEYHFNRFTEDENGDGIDIFNEPLNPLYLTDLGITAQGPAWDEYVKRRKNAKYVKILHDVYIRVLQSPNFVI